MDRRNFKKPEQSDRKTDIKDRGDLKKVTERVIKNVADAESDARVTPDRGDSNRKSKLYKSNKLVEIQRSDALRTDKQVNKIETEIRSHKDSNPFNVRMTPPDRYVTSRKSKLDKIDKVVEIQRTDQQRTEKTETDIQRIKNTDNSNVRVTQPDRADSDRKVSLDKTKIPFSKKVVEIQKNNERATNSVKKIEIEISRNRNPREDREGNKEKAKIAFLKKVMEIQRADVPLDGMVKKSDIESTQHRNTELDEKRRIKDNFTLKAKVPNRVSPSNTVRKEIVNAKNFNVGKSNLETSKIVPDRPTKKFSGVTKDKPDSTSIPSVDKDIPYQKRPVIKTITSKNDATKVFKAVTFVERKIKPTMIQVKLPDEYKSPKNSDTSAVIKQNNGTSKESIEFDESTRSSVTPKKVRGKKKNVKRLSESPDTLVRENSPQTEVAKWAPSCINKHTKPYYEAWVSTTLAAISKASKKDKLFLEKQHILEAFQKSLVRRPDTPDLVYENFHDERYTGRIKVRQR